MFYSLKMFERKKKNLSVHLSVSQVISPGAGARVLGFGLRAVFAQSLSISRILKVQMYGFSAALRLHGGV